MGTDGCGHCENEDRPKDEWTCHCGIGYYDFTLQQFIPGGRVKDGKVRDRQTYDAHVAICDGCREIKNMTLKHDRQKYLIRVLPSPTSPYFLPGDLAEQRWIEDNVARLLCSDASVKQAQYLLDLSSCILIETRPVLGNMRAMLLTPPPATTGGYVQPEATSEYSESQGQYGTTVQPTHPQYSPTQSASRFPQQYHELYPPRGLTEYGSPENLTSSPQQPPVGYGMEAMSGEMEALRFDPHHGTVSQETHRSGHQSSTETPRRDPRKPARDSKDKSKDPRKSRR